MSICPCLPVSEGGGAAEGEEPGVESCTIYLEGWFRRIALSQEFEASLRNRLRLLGPRRKTEHVSTKALPVSGTNSRARLQEYKIELFNELIH